MRIQDKIVRDVLSALEKSVDDTEKNLDQVNVQELLIEVRRLYHLWDRAMRGKFISSARDTSTYPATPSSISQKDG